MGTVRLFDDDAYVTDFKAQAVAVIFGEDYTCITLDKTLFFPEQGGQTCDRGTLAGFAVTAVSVDENDVITHKISGVHPEIKPGDILFGTIDFKHRFYNMQQHTGEHIFSGICYKKYGYENVGFHLSDNVVTLDTSGPLTDAQLDELEMLVNRAIIAGKKVTAYYPKAAELEKLAYRSKSGIVGDVRIVEIEDTDCCACCAPHVRNTAEVGFFKIMDAVKYKGGMRITFLCGYRALEAFREALKLQGILSARLSSAPSDLPSSVDRLKAEAGALKAEVSHLQGALLNEKLRGLDDSADDVLLFVDEVDTKVMRDAVNELTRTHSGYCGIFAGEKFVIGSSGRDCNEAAGLLREGLGVKCGGSSEMIMGSAAASEADIRKVLGI